MCTIVALCMYGFGWILSVTLMLDRIQPPSLTPPRVTNDQHRSSPSRSRNIRPTLSFTADVPPFAKQAAAHGPHSGGLLGYTLCSSPLPLPPPMFDTLSLARRRSDPRRVSSSVHSCWNRLPPANPSPTSRRSSCGSGTQTTDDYRHSRPSEHIRRLANVRTTNVQPQPY
ncbi:hypothetical protein C8Q79DRAFT_708406 [Trametes meyenii]|nr:hypothetical protein C8Q79DRAFT_708406 [Trametes meyenii]